MSEKYPWGGQAHSWAMTSGYTAGKNAVGNKVNIQQAVITITKYAYAVPLVTYTVEDGFGHVFDI